MAAGHGLCAWAPFPPTSSDLGQPPTSVHHGAGFPWGPVDWPSPTPTHPHPPVSPGFTHPGRRGRGWRLGHLLDPCPLCPAFQGWKASIHCWAGRKNQGLPGGGGYPGTASQSGGQGPGELNVIPVVGRRNYRIRRALICLRGPGFGPQAWWGLPGCWLSSGLQKSGFIRQGSCGAGPKRLRSVQRAP